MYHAVTPCQCPGRDFDWFAKKFEADNPGVRLDRTAAVRVLLLQALAQLEEPAIPKKKR
jgi:hypothetical protein